MPDNNINVIILAAGEGTRLRPYTLDKPKCLVQVDGASLLERQLDVIRSVSLSLITVVGGYKSEMLGIDGVELRVNPRFYETNMVWTLFSVEDKLDGDVLISYGDIVYSREILHSLLNSKADISVTIDKEWESYWRERNEDPLDDAETLKLGPNNSIYEIGQSPESINDIEGQYMGLIKLSAEGVRQVKEVYYKALNENDLLGKSVENAYMTDLLQAIIDVGYSVTAVPVYGGWVEIDTTSDLCSAITKDRLRHIEHSLNGSFN